MKIIANNIITDPMVNNNEIKENNILDKHFDEWVKSGVDVEIIKLNVRSCYDKSEIYNLLNLKTCTLRQEKLYDKVLNGGWVCDFLLKPDYPRTNNNKPIKYENPIGFKPHPIKLKVTDKKWQKIADKYGVRKEGRDFWQWVIDNPKIPLMVVEGVKKAGCVISNLLIPAIALPGHTLAYEQYEQETTEDKNGFGKDTEDKKSKKLGLVTFNEFVNFNRLIYIALDNDVKSTTCKTIATTIRGIHKRIYNRCILKICQWKNHEGKGLDDVFANSGLQTLQRIINEACTFDKWCDLSHKVLGWVPDISFNSKQFQYTPILDKDCLLVGVKAPKGTGKSWYAERLVEDAKKQKMPVMMFTHRIQLSRSLGKRLKLDYIDDIDGSISKTNRIALVIDSLAKIDVQQFSGALVIIDEVVQVLEHLQLSETCKYKRINIVRKLKELALLIKNTNGMFVILDADLDEKAVQYFIGLLDGDIKPLIIENTYSEPSYSCQVTDGFETQLGENSFINTPIDLVYLALEKARNSEKILICCSGQDETSKYGTINLEKLFLKEGILPIRIDSETTKNPDHPAFKASSKINKISSEYRVIIASPALSTGVSIESRDFNAVFGIFSGVTSTDSARQALARVRDNTVPRFIYITEEGFKNEYSKLGSTQYQVQKNIDELSDIEKEQLNKINVLWTYGNEEIRYCNTSTNHFCQLISGRNKERIKYKNYVVQGLKNENVSVSEAGVFHVEKVDLNKAYKELKSLKDESVDDYRDRLISYQDGLISSEELNALNNLEQTDEERERLESTLLSRKYCGKIKITKELIEKDKNGYHKQLKLHYAFTKGYELTKKIHVYKASNQVKYSNNSLVQNDFIQSQKLLAQVNLLKEIGLIKLLPKDELSELDEDVKNVFKALRRDYEKFTLLFNRKLKDTDDFDFSYIQTLLELIGLKSSCIKRKGKKDNRTRIYSKASPQINKIKRQEIEYIDDNRELVFEAWLTRDTEKVEKWSEIEKEIEVNKLLSLTKPNISIDTFENLKKQRYFDEAWEKTNTETRIKLINKSENYYLPTIQPEQISDGKLSKQLSDINTWETISLDIETFGSDEKNNEGLHAIKGNIRLIQISNGEKVYCYDFGGRKNNKLTKYKQFTDLLFKKLQDEETKIIGHNIHFDLRFIAWKFNIRDFKNVYDTLTGVKIFFGDYGGVGVLPGGYNLKNLCKNFLDVDIDKTEQKSDWGSNSLSQSQIKYAAYDPYYTYHLYKRIEDLYQNPCKYGFKKLAQTGIKENWILENQVITGAIELELNGVPIDKTLAKSMLGEYKKVQSELLQQWVGLVPEINYTQTQKIKEFINKKYNLNLQQLTKANITDHKELPEITILSKLRAIKIPIQQTESLIRSSEKTGRIQTVFKTLTGTGRFSCGDSKKFDDLPNLQSISSKDNPALQEYFLPKVRQCIKPSEGKGLGVIDLAAAHARIASDLAKDANSIASFNDDSIDNHSKVAVYVAKALGHKTTWEEIQKNKKKQPYKSYRDTAKNTYYGWLNGAGASRVQEQIKANSGQIVDIEACKAAIKGCEELYPNIVNYRKQLMENLVKDDNLLYVNNHVFIINKVEKVNNRILHKTKESNSSFDLPYTQVLAAIWSRTEATVLKKSLLDIIELSRTNPNWELQTVNYVHDEINVEFNILYAVEVLTRVRDIIGNNFKNILDAVSDGRESDPLKLLANDWSEK